MCTKSQYLNTISTIRARLQQDKNNSKKQRTHVVGCAQCSRRSVRNEGDALKRRVVDVRNGFVAVCVRVKRDGKTEKEEECRVKETAESRPRDESGTLVERLQPSVSR